MKKEDIIKILTMDGEFTQKELKKMKINDLQKLYDERFPIIEEKKIGGFLENHDFQVSTNLKSDNMDDMKDEEKNVVIDISKLSKHELREYRRSGKLPIQ